MDAGKRDDVRKEVIPLRTFLKSSLIYRELLRAAIRRARGSAMEVGTGSGAQSAMLSRFVSRVVTLDASEPVLTVARRNLAEYGPDVLVVRGDALTLPFADATFGVAVSQGLVEYLDDASVGMLLREQLRVCRSVVFSVPSDNYPRRDVGHARLMSPDEWLDIVRRAVGDGYRVKADYARYDLEAVKYSIKAKRRLGGFSVLVTIDRGRMR